MRAAWLLSLGLILPAGRALGAEASSDTVKLVERFLKTATPDLPPGRIDEFLAVDPETLPARLRVSYRAKRNELYSLKRVAETKKRGFVRTPEANCAPPPGAKGTDLAAMRFSVGAGFMDEIQEEEEQYLIDKTKCSEDELLCESSLQIAIERDPKTKKTKRHFFMNPSDPFMSFIAQFREGKQGGNTQFFGRGNGPICSH